MAISITTTTNNSNNNNDDDDDDDSTDNDSNNDNTIKTHSRICTMQFMYRNVTSYTFVDLKLWIYKNWNKVNATNINESGGFYTRRVSNTARL